MNFAAVISALKYAIEHRADIAQAAREAIHVVRRLESITHHNNKTVDDILTDADDVLKVVENPRGEPPEVNDELHARCAKVDQH